MNLQPCILGLEDIYFKCREATKNNIIGLTIGFSGTAALILFSDSTNNSEANLYGLFVVLATLLYGINLNLVKYHLNHLKPVTITSFSIVLILPITLYVLFFSTPFIEHIQSFSDYKNVFIYVFILGIFWLIDSDQPWQLCMW